jgi:hypothetical protein
MDKRNELLRKEDQAWERLSALIHEVPEERMTEPGVTPIWSVKDLMAHLACWMAEATHQFERVHFGTYERSSLDLDAINQDFYEATKDLELPLVRAELDAARTRMLQEFFALPELPDIAVEWFLESGPDHIDEHLPDLDRFVRSKR